MSEANAVWAASLPVFLRRSLIVGALTLVIMGLLGWAIGATQGIWQVLYVGPVLVLAYTIGFEDAPRWRAARQNRWHFRSDALIHLGPDGEARIPLANLADVRKRLGLTVVVFFKNGLRVCLLYVHHPDAVSAPILAARGRLTA